MRLLKLLPERTRDAEQQVSWSKGRYHLRLRIGRSLYEEAGFLEGDHLELFIDPEARPHEVIIREVKAGGWLFRTTNPSVGVAVGWLKPIHRQLLFPEGDATFTASIAEVEGDTIIVRLPEGKSPLEILNAYNSQTSRSRTGD